MAASIPTIEPASARAGDTWQWRREDLSADYPASAWTLTYYFRNASGHFDITATADGDNFAISVAKATTAGYTSGNYDWIAVAISATERHPVASGRLILLPDFSAAANLDARSWARKLLDAIEASLSARATGDQLDLINATLETRGLTREKGGLVLLRNQMIAEVKREEDAQRIANGLQSKNRILVRFVNA